MFFRLFARLVFCACAFCLPAACSSPGSHHDASALSTTSASTLPSGRWTGWVKPEREALFQVTYDVKAIGSEIDIRVNGPRGQTFTFTDVHLSNNKLTFIWPLLFCALNRGDSGAFEGDCALPDGSDRAHIAMIPPTG